jgi:GTP-binding protein
LLDGASPDPLGDFDAINQELSLFNPKLSEKPQIVVLNKMDLPDAQERWPEVQQAMQAKHIPVMNISAIRSENVQELLRAVRDMLDTLSEPEEAPVQELVEITPEQDERAFRVLHLDDHSWRVEGIAIERAAKMTNWDYYEAGMRFQRIMQALGVTDALREAGVQEGDTVIIADLELVWGYENAIGE